VIDVKEGFGVLARCENRAQTSPFVIGGTSKDWEAVRVRVRARSGDVAEPGFLDSEDMMIGGLEEGMHHVIAAAHVHRQYLDMA
jgi:hypothetical protein